MCGHPSISGGLVSVSHCLMTVANPVRIFSLSPGSRLSLRLIFGRLVLCSFLVRGGEELDKAGGTTLMDAGGECRFRLALECRSRRSATKSVGTGTELTDVHACTRVFCHECLCCLILVCHVKKVLQIRVSLRRFAFAGCPLCCSETTPPCHELWQDSLAFDGLSSRGLL